VESTNERGLDKHLSWVYISKRKLLLQAKVKANLKVAPEVEVKRNFFYNLTRWNCGSTLIGATRRH